MPQKKSKKFDCVEMKRQAQERLQREFESRGHEFANYVEFLREKSRETLWQREFWARFSDEPAKQR